MKHLKHILAAMAAVVLAVSAAFAATPAKKEVWLFLSGPDMKDAHLVAATLAWMAEECGAICDSYGEVYRDGRLFAEHGSQVIAGRHFQDLNYLCARADVKFITYGRTTLFDSTLDVLGCEKLAGGTAGEIYSALFAKRPRLLAAVGGCVRFEGFDEKLSPYLYPEIAYAKKLYLPAAVVVPAGMKCETVKARKNETWASLTLRMSLKWKNCAKSVFFGDPAALACRVPAEVRRRSVPVFDECKWLLQRDVLFSGYAESTSPLAAYASSLACELGDRVILGRQTSDGDIFRWSKDGCCVQIVDPYRPTFPCIELFPQKWAKDEKPADDDPSDDQLREWAKKGMILTTLLWHSGEIAHNEAMLNVIEYAQFHKFKMGIAVHAQRYETCPQLWELLRVPMDRGGAAELIEPVLHAGALGVAAEAKFPPEQFTKNLKEAKKRIAAIAGEANVPTGFYAFMDSDLRTCSQPNPVIWKAAAAAGLDYFVSSCSPGRPRILSQDGITVINQTYRVVETSSPFVRLSESVDLQRGPGVSGPGWRIGVLDAPVVAFTPYIWEKGNRFIALTEQLKTHGWYINVKPRVIARYAKIISELGIFNEKAVGAVAVPTAPDANGR